MAEIYSRMPAILDESDWPKWLGEEPATDQELLALLRPCPDDRLKIWKVDNKIGNVRNTGPELILPVEDSAAASKRRQRAAFHYLPVI